LDCMNHSCSPNSVLEVGRLAFIALRDISRGDEITFFYPGSEMRLAQPFLCRCGDESCLGHVEGGLYLSEEQMEDAVSRGLCTEFMEWQFHTLLGSARWSALRNETSASPSAAAPGLVLARKP
jgi:hypothetical protein